MNPRGNLKSEEKLDSLTGQEGKSRSGRREPLIKSYRLVYPLFPTRNPANRKFSPRRSRRLSSPVFLPCPCRRPRPHFSRRPPRTVLSFFHHGVVVSAASLTTPVILPSYFSRPLLICFNYTARRSSPLIVNYREQPAATSCVRYVVESVVTFSSPLEIQPTLTY